MFQHRDQILNVLASGFAGAPVLVVGDLMLDRYLWGQVQRVSPEAPVPVVHLYRESESCGGAANVALNLARLGARPLLAGVVGEDDDGARLLAMLQQQGVATDGVIATPGRTTITKTRVIGGHQQMLRIDREERAPLSDATLAALWGEIEEVLERTAPAVVVLSDYAKGVLAPELCQHLIRHGRARGIPVLVDPKGSDFDRYRGATALSPNRQELAAASGAPAAQLDGLLEAGARLRAGLALDFLAVTLSELGIALVEEAETRRIPAMAREVFDVSGAGDTVIATLAAGLAAGLQRLDALHLANLAAGVVVGKVGTTPIARAELLAAVTTEEALAQSAKVVELADLRERAAEWRRRGERIVFTNGCFDLLHAGHVDYLEKARRLGQRLVVGLNTDRSVSALKGPSRPVIHQDDRARVLAALAAVDAVILFDDDTPLALIEALRPDLLVKGADYTEAQVVGGELVKSWGGQVALIPLTEGRSTSRIVQRLGSGQESSS